MSCLKQGTIAAALSLFLAGGALAQGQVHTPRVHALTNVRIVTAPGEVIERGTVVIRDGLIEAVGASAAVPADARVWDCDSLTVYAGFIDLAMNVSPGEGDKEKDKSKKTEDLEHDLSVVRPDMVLADALALKDSDREARRNAGFTTVRALPDRGAFRGQALILNLGDGGLGGNILRRQAGQVMAFSTARGESYPNSVMGTVAVMRQTFSDAAWYASAMKTYAATPRGLERPEANAAFAALGPVVSGTEPVVFVTDDVLGLLRADEIAKEFGVRFAYVGNGEEYKRLNDVVAAAGGSIILPVNFPEAPKVGSGGAALNVKTETLRHWDHAPANPAEVHGAGVTVAFTAEGLKDPSKFREQMAKAIERGFPEDLALAGCTTVPAHMAGLDQQVGKVETGLIANLVVVDGDLFAKDTKIREVWVDGDRYEVEKVEPPVGDPRGTWEYTATAEDGGTYPGTVIVGGEIGALTASVVAMGQTIEAKATQSGKTLTISFSTASLGMAGTLRFSVSLDGDSASGSGNSPMGGFSMSMTRTKKFEAEPGLGGSR